MQSVLHQKLIGVCCWSIEKLQPIKPNDRIGYSVFFSVHEILLFRRNSLAILLAVIVWCTLLTIFILGQCSCKLRRIPFDQKSISIAAVLLLLLTWFFGVSIDQQTHLRPILSIQFIYCRAHNNWPLLLLLCYSNMKREKEIERS